MKPLLQEDLLLLEQKLLDIEKQLFELGEEFNEAVNQSSETWHDNAPFDAARDRQSILQYEKNSLLDIRINARIHKTKKPNKVDVGHTVTLHADQPVKVCIAGEWSGREHHGDAKIVTCGSPIAVKLLGKKVGDTIELPRATYTISSIC